GVRATPFISDHYVAFGATGFLAEFHRVLGRLGLGITATHAIGRVLFTDLVVNGDNSPRGMRGNRNYHRHSENQSNQTFHWKSFESEVTLLARHAFLLAMTAAPEIDSRSTSKRSFGVAPLDARASTPPRSFGVPGSNNRAARESDGRLLGNKAVRSRGARGPAKIGLAGLANGKCRHTAYRAAFVREIRHAFWCRYGDWIVGFRSEPK